MQVSLRDDVPVHRQMMFLPDAPLLLETASVIENLVTFLRAYGREQAAPRMVPRRGG